AEALAAATPLERVLVAISAELLRVPSVPIRESLVENGLHSMNAARLTTTLRDFFGVSIPIRRVLQAPTVRALAASLLECGTASEVRQIAELIDGQLSKWTDGSADAGLAPGLLTIEGRRLVREALRARGSGESTAKALSGPQPLSTMSFLFLY